MTEPETTRASVFISYSRRDRDFVQALREACANDGRPSWIDTTDIRPVSEWSVEIAEGIDASDAVICVVSPDFVSSEQCAKELEHASQQKKRLVPVVARPVDPASLPPVLARLQWISFCDGTSFDAAFAALGSALDTDLDWLKAHTRLQNRAREWEASGQRASRLLRGRDLAEAETWLAGAHGRQPAPTPLQSQMVVASRRRATRTQRLLVSGLTGGLLVTLALAAAALIQRNAAREARDEAIARLYTQQLALAGNLVPGDPGLALDTLDETLRTAGSRREFTWDLYRNLSSRTVFAVGGMRNNFTNEADRPAIALSRDGRQLATSFLRQSKRWRDGNWMVATEILLWDTATGQRRRTISVSETLESDAGEIATLVFASDDRQLAACIKTYPGVVKVWDVATGAELMSVEEEFVQSATFLDEPSGGRRLVATGSIGGMTIWDRIGPAAVKRRVAARAVHALAVDTRTSELVTAEPQGIVSRNLERNTQTSVQNPASAADPTALSPENSRIAQASFDRVYVWRIGKPGVEWRLEGGHRESINVVAFSPDGRTLASGGADYVVRLWDLDRGIATRTLRGPAAGVLALEFSRDGRRLAAGSADASVFVWDVAATPLQPSERVETSGVPACVGFSAEHGAMLLTSTDTVTLQRSTESGRRALLTIPGKVGSCAMTTDGRTLFLVDEQSRVLVADAATGTIRHRLDVTSRPESVRLSADGAFVAAYVGPRTFAVWSADQGTRLASIDVDGELEGPLALLDTGVVVAQFRKERDAWIGAWDIRQAKRLSLTKVPAWAYRSQFAACSPALFAIGEGYTVRIVDVAAGRITRELPWNEGQSFGFDNHLTKLVFSPDCSHLAIGDAAGHISLWSLASGTRLYGVLAHAGIQQIQWRDARGFGTKTLMNADGVNAVAFSPDGRTLVSGGGTAAGRGELKLWDAERGALLATLPADAGSVKDARFFRAGGRLGVLLQRTNQNAGGATTIVEVWSAESSERILLAADVEPIEGLSFQVDGRQLVTEASSAIKTWDLASRRLVASSRRPQPPSDARASGRVEARLRDNVGVFAQENILYVEQTMEAPRPLLSGDETYFHSEPIQQLLVVGGDMLVSLAGYRDVRSKPAEIVMWDLSAGRPAHEALEPSNVVAGLAFSPDRKIFVTVGGIGTALQDSGFVHVWDAQRFTHIKTLIGYRARVTAVAFSADGRQLATGDIKGFVRVWDMQQLTDVTSR